MKHILICLFSLLVMNCAVTREVVKEDKKRPSFMPQFLNLDSIGFKARGMDEIVDPKLPDFGSMSLEKGMHLTINGKDSLWKELPAGILISEKSGAKYVFYKSGYERLAKEFDVTKLLMQSYYDGAVRAEKVYQVRIEELEKQVERNWFEKNIIYFGFVAGLATAILTEFAVVGAAK